MTGALVIAHCGDSSLFWSNAEGWTDSVSCDTFTPLERETLRLPMGGAWALRSRLEAARGLPAAYANGASLDLLTGLICDALGYPNADALLDAATVQESPSCIRDRDRTHGAARYALEVIRAARGKRGIARRRELAPLPLALSHIGAAMASEMTA